MRGDMTQQVLELIYGLFYGSGGIWPTLGDLQRALNRRGNSGVDAVHLVQHIPAMLLKPVPCANAYPAPTEKLILTVEGIERCAGSGQDIENFIIAVKWLARRAERSDVSGDQGELGVRFTTCQLAEAVSLSLDADQDAVSRVVAILQSEGWVRDDGDTRGKP